METVCPHDERLSAREIVEGSLSDFEDSGLAIYVCAQWLNGPWPLPTRTACSVPMTAEGNRVKLPSNRKPGCHNPLRKAFLVGDRWTWQSDRPLLGVDRPSRADSERRVKRPSNRNPHPSDDETHLPVVLYVFRPVFRNRFEYRFCQITVK